MTITLRKANALKLLINDRLSKLSSIVASTQVVVGKYDDALAVVNAAAKNLEAAINQKTILNVLLFSIRKRVAAKSQEIGIADLLAELALNDKQAETLQQIASVQQVRPTDEVIVKSAADLQKEITQNVYSRTVSINVSIINPEAIQLANARLSNIRKNKVKIGDKLLELNIKNEIELSDDEEKLLKDFDLI